MAAASYYQNDPFPNSNPSTGSNLYSGHEYDIQPLRPTKPFRPGLHTTNSDSNVYHSTDHEIIPPTNPSRPALYTAHSDHNSNNYDRPPNHSSTDPATKPLVQPTTNHTSGPYPLKIQTPASRLRQRKYQTLKRYLRILKILTKTLTTLFAALMFALMIYTTEQYTTTKNEIRSGRTAWPAHPKTWPTYMLLAGSGLTLLLSIITLLSYCCAFGRARRSWILTLVKYAIHIGAWLVITALYRYEKGLHGVEDDLWGWSCSSKATAIQGQFQGVVEFSTLCSVQVCGPIDTAYESSEIEKENHIN